MNELCQTHRIGLTTSNTLEESSTAGRSQLPDALEGEDGNPYKVFDQTLTVAIGYVISGAVCRR